MYKSKTLPQCMVHLDDGGNLTIGGDSTATLAQMRLFTGQFLALARTR